MAWGLGGFGAAYTAALAKDKPILVGSNRLLPSASAQWRASGSFASGSDSASASGPTSRLSDDFTHLQSFPTVTGDNYLCFDFGAAGIAFDTVAVLNHNLPTTSSGSPQVSVQLGNNNSFSSGFFNILTLTPITAGRRLIFLLGNRVTTCQYVRIFFEGIGAIAPRVGEVMFGNRSQLNWHPDVPYDDQAMVTPSVRKVATVSGITRAVRLGPIGQRRVRARTPLDSAAQQADVLAFWKEHGGVRPFLWIDYPLTLPHRAALLHLDSPELSRPYTDALNREWTLEATEQGPHFVGLEP